jgi:CRISPR/Cas system-associated exonuclease Cas4 (RecB family)
LIVLLLIKKSSLSHNKMAKTNAERQKLYRVNLSKDTLKAEETKKKARLRDNTRRKNLDAKSLEKLRLRQKNASKNYRDKLKGKRLNNNQSSTYKSRQTLGKAVQRTLKSLPKNPHRRHHVVHHIAQLLDVIPKSIDKHKREQRSISIESKKSVTQFYNRDDISYQMPGKRDCITVDDDNGQRITLQKRILLFSIREAYQLFLAENKHANVRLSATSFRELRPIYVLVF